MSIRTLGVPIGLATAGALVLSGCGGSTSGSGNHLTHQQVKQKIRERAPEVNKNGASLVVSSNPRAGRRAVTVKKVVIGPEGKKTGYVALASDVSGRPSQLLGYTMVPHGTSDNVRVTSSTNLVGGKYFVLVFVASHPPNSANGAETKRQISVAGS